MSTTTGGERPVSGFSKCKSRLVALSGVTKDWRLHDFRRTAGTSMAGLGVPVFTIGRVLNHSATGMAGVTAVYNRHSYLEEKRHALESWANRITSIINPEDDDKVVQLRRRD